jgi:hypothetical protein
VALEAILRCPGIERRLFVSKNVTDRVVYDRSLHSLLEPLRDRSVALQLIWQGMDCYLGPRHAAKKLHDVLTAACALDEGVCRFAEVELFWEKKAGAGCWGTRLSSGTGTWISVDHDRSRFLRLLVECAGWHRALPADAEPWC